MVEENELSHARTRVGELNTENRALRAQVNAQASAVTDAHAVAALTAKGALTEVNALYSRVAELEKVLNQAYTERARLVAYLAARYPSSLGIDAENGWPVVYVETPRGQLSWHVAEDDLPLFAHVRRGLGGGWDGHTTEEKYDRLSELVHDLA